MASKAAALPPVRTGGKKAPSGPPVSARAPASGVTPRSSAPAAAPAPSTDGKKGVAAAAAREREERMALVRAAKAEASQPASARAQPANSAAAPASARAAQPAPAAAAPAPASRRESGGPQAAAPAPAAPAKSAAAAAPARKPSNAAPAPQKPAPGGKSTPPPAPAGASAQAPSEEQPLKNPKYTLDGPVGVKDAAKALVYECFQGEGMLFRIAEPAATPNTSLWHFYNDTTDLLITAEVTFALGSTLKVLSPTATSKVNGNTGETVVVDKIPPGKTQPFVEGKIRGYACGFSADEFSGEAKVADQLNAEAVREKELAAMLAAAKAHNVDATDQGALVEMCAAHGIPYVDATFTGATLFFREGVDEPIDTFPLMRPTQYLPPAMRNVLRLINSVEPNDIDQGLLGDCWFLCAISSLAEFPDKVEDIFEHPESKEVAAREAKVGAYRVTVMFDGWWNTVILDDYFPTQGGRAAFAKNIEDPAELWVSFIEKAYAKLKGSYASIVGGDALHALEDLTGYPTTRLDRKFNAAIDDPEAADSLFLDLLRYDEAGYLITVGTPTPADDDPPDVVKAFEEKYDEVGLTVDHSYSVITVKHYPEKGIKLLKIRNPWGNDKEWGGAWADESDDWKQHPDIAKDCGFDGALSDGTFWMQWSDVLDYFESGGVCFMSRNWRDCRTRGTFSGGRPSVSLRVKCNKRTKAFLVLSQAPKPGFDASKPSAKYAGAMLSVWKPDPSDSARYKTDLNSAFEFDVPTPEFTFLVGRSIGLLYTFEPRAEPYMVVPRIYDASLTRDYCLGIISEHSVGDTAAHALGVEFCRVDGAEAAFENYEQFPFNPSSDATLVEAPYQVNPEEGAPYSDTGSCVKIRDAFGEASVRRSFNK